MALELIVGPPGSGRSTVILDRFSAAIEHRPLLVVPTGDDVDRFERRLGERAQSITGGTVVSFPGLFATVGRVYGIATPAPLTRVQRRWLARAATRATNLRRLARSAAREGFPPALEALLADLQSEGIDAAGFADLVEAAPEAGPLERELGELFSAYERLREARGAVDEHVQEADVTAALRADPERWGARPALLYGFDDLSRNQIELIAALAAAGPVYVAIAYEDRAALEARAKLLGTLRDELGGTITERLDPAGRAAGPGTLLRHLERNLFEPGAARTSPDDSLRLIEAPGERAEGEAIGRRIAGLLAAGTDPDRIAIAVRSPDRQAMPIARALARLGIPAAAEATVPLARTATGAALAELLGIAAGDAPAATVVSFLRRPARARPEAVDWLERTVLRRRLQTAEEALAAWAGEDEARRLWPLDALREAGDDPEALAEALARVAADVAERPYRRAGIVPSSGPALELRAAAEAGRALREAAALGPEAPRGPAELLELLGQVRVPLWRGATEGRVRILSPQRLRAARVEHLFVAGLSEGSFPAGSAADPLLSDERRRILALPERRDPVDEERYLFYVCASRPSRSLTLSTPSGGAAGETPPSAFLDEVRALLDPGSPAEGLLADAAGSGVVPPGQACTTHDLARSLAALGGDAEAAAERLEIPAQTRAEALAELAAARRGLTAARAPGPLRDPAVLAELAARDPLGASTLEGYHLCSYRWFIGHELDPQPLGPDPEAPELGGIVHAALERLYANPPRPPGRPTPETATRWIARARELVRAEATERGWDLESARCRVSLARVDAILDRYLRRDAETGGPLMPDPDLLEARFGGGPDAQFGPVDLGGFHLHGAIDRIDREPGGRRVLIRDYKLSATVPTGKSLIDEGRLQLPLYMLAMRELGFEPIGGLYSPLAASSKDRPRGLLAKDQKGELIPGETAAHVGTDFFDEEKLEEILERGREEAQQVVAGIRAGRIARNPRGGSCPSWCAFAPICRIERGVVVAEDDEEEALDAG